MTCAVWIGTRAGGHGAYDAWRSCAHGLCPKSGGRRRLAPARSAPWLVARPSSGETSLLESVRWFAMPASTIPRAVRASTAFGSTRSSVVESPAKVVRRETSLVHRETSLVHRETSFVYCETSLVSCKTSFVHNETSLVSYETSLVQHETSLVSCKTSFVHNETSLVSCETSLVSYETSLVQHETSLVSCETSFVQSETSLVHDETGLGKRRTSFVLERALLCVGGRRLVHCAPALGTSVGSVVSTQTWPIARRTSA
jgi:hypothetical protein